MDMSANPLAEAEEEKKGVSMEVCGGVGVDVEGSDEVVIRKP